jgi:26S proteasome non-ATPase regulatory subunit 10
MIASSLKDTSSSDPLIDLLLAKNADPTLTTSTGATALHFAASKSNLDTAKKLLEHKASARVKDKRGQLPLHRAAAVGNVPMVKLLLQSRSPVNASDGDGCTALHHAIAEGHGDAAVVLLKAGAETDKKDGNGALALDLAPDAKVSLDVLLLGVVEYAANFCYRSEITSKELPRRRVFHSRVNHTTAGVLSSLSSSPLQDISQFIIIAVSLERHLLPLLPVILMIHKNTHPQPSKQAHQIFEAQAEIECTQKSKLMMHPSLPHCLRHLLRPFLFQTPSKQRLVFANLNLSVEEIRSW